jgi:hypothetical protein
MKQIGNTENTRIWQEELRPAFPATSLGTGSNRTSVIKINLIDTSGTVHSDGIEAFLNSIAANQYEVSLKQIQGKVKLIINKNNPLSHVEADLVWIFANKLYSGDHLFEVGTSLEDNYSVTASRSTKEHMKSSPGVKFMRLESFKTKFEEAGFQLLDANLNFGLSKKILRQIQAKLFSSDENIEVPDDVNYISYLAIVIRNTSDITSSAATGTMKITWLEEDTQEVSDLSDLVEIER